jgi:hypothetical protein
MRMAEATYRLMDQWKRRNGSGCRNWCNLAWWQIASRINGYLGYNADENQRSLNWQAKTKQDFGVKGVFNSWGIYDDWSYDFYRAAMSVNPTLP